MDHQCFEHILNERPVDITKELTIGFQGTLIEMSEFLEKRYPQSWLEEAYCVMYDELSSIVGTQKDAIGGMGDDLRQAMDPLWYAMTSETLRKVEAYCRQRNIDPTSFRLTKFLSINKLRK